MRKSLFVIAALMAWSAPAQAEDLMDWLHSVSATPSGKKPVAADSAKLLTLEPGENEMYAKPSPDGKFMLAMVNKGKRMWVSRRYIENGDPAGIVTEDPRAFDSIAWHGREHVYFLSNRAGGLGLWEKISDGEGMQRRLLNMRGTFTEAVLLADDSVIAVRLNRTEPRDQQHAGSRTSRDGFINWEHPGYNAELVRIGSNGDEKVLSQGINPALSPDGKWIAFSMPVGRSYHLFRMHPDGSELIQVTDARSVDVQPAWSPDGKWIVFTSNRQHPDMLHSKRSNWDIWAIDPAGRHLTQLSKDAARDGGAEVGANGRVYFHSDRRVDAQEIKARMVDHAQQGFHIWSLPLPSTDIHGEQMPH